MIYFTPRKLVDSTWSLANIYGNNLNDPIDLFHKIKTSFSNVIYEEAEPFVILRNDGIAPQVQVVNDEDGYYTATIPLPGFCTDDVSACVKGNRFVITGTRDLDDVPTIPGFSDSDTFVLQLSLPNGFQISSANLKNGLFVVVASSIEPDGEPTNIDIS